MIRVVVCLVIIASSIASAGWRHECRVAARICRQNRGTVLSTLPTTTTSTTSTTTTLAGVTLAPATFYSQNCGGQPAGCVTVQGGPQNGMILCPPLAVMAADCSFPVTCPPVQHVTIGGVGGQPIDCVLVEGQRYCANPQDQPPDRILAATTTPCSSGPPQMCVQLALTPDYIPWPQSFCTPACSP